MHISGYFHGEKKVSKILKHFYIKYLNFRKLVAVHYVDTFLFFHCNNTATLIKLAILSPVLPGTTKSELISWGYESVQKRLNALDDRSHDSEPCSDLCCLRGDHNRYNRATRTFLRREIQTEEKERSSFLTTQCHIWRKRKTKQCSLLPKAPFGGKKESTLKPSTNCHKNKGLPSGEKGEIIFC